MTSTLTHTKVRIATLADELHIVTCFSRMLRELASMEHDVLPTEHNVDWFWDNIFAPALEVNRHGIVLAFAGGECVGASLFIPERAVIDVPKGRAIAYGLWVDPEWRRQGIATELHRLAHSRLIKLGCKTLLSFVLLANEAGLGNVEARAGTKMAYMVSIPLKGDY